MGLKIEACPPILRSAGRANTSNVTIVETGFPGRPNIGLPPTKPKASGWPGFIPTLQNFISIPYSFKISFTTSYSPARTQPLRPDLVSRPDVLPFRGLAVHCRVVPWREIYPAVDILRQYPSTRILQRDPLWPKNLYAVQNHLQCLFDWAHALCLLSPSAISLASFQSSIVFILNSDLNSGSSFTHSPAATLLMESPPISSINPVMFRRLFPIRSRR